MAQTRCQQPPHPHCKQFMSSACYSKGHEVSWEEDRPICLGSRPGQGDVATSALPPSISGFSLEKPGRGTHQPLLKAASPDRPLSLRLAGTLCWVRLICLMGGLAWGAGGALFGGPLLSRRQLYSDRRLGFPAPGPGSLPRVISQLKACQEEDSHQPSGWGSLERGGRRQGAPRTPSLGGGRARETFLLQAGASCTVQVELGQFISPL